MSQLLDTKYVLGTWDGITLTKGTLTAAYTDNVSGAVDISNIPQIVLDIEYTMGAAETSNSIQLKVEFANPLPAVPTKTPATTDWHQEVSESVVAGVSTVYLKEYSFSATQAAGTYDRFQIAIPVCSRFMRVSTKETGRASNFGTFSIRLVKKEEEVIS